MMRDRAWVYCEREGGGISEVSLQGVALLRGWADAHGGEVGCVVLGSGARGLAVELFAHGADTAFCAEDPRLDAYRAAPFCSVLADLCRRHRPELFLFPATTQGNDLASALAASLGAGSVIDCDAVVIDREPLLLRRREYDRKVFTSYVIPEGRPRIVTMKEGVAERGEPSSGREGEVCSVDVVLGEEDLVPQLLRRDVASRAVNLKDARVIVAAGAGLGNKENFKLVEELAHVLGGEVGATRAAVDAGWTTYDRQIGQTGLTVRPELYIACGISGAIQHRVGMMESRKIVSINTDPSAPIFKVSHYGIVGDVAQVAPKLIQLIKGEL